MFGVDDAIAAGAKLVDDVVTRIWPDATEIEKAKLEQATAEIKNQYSLVLGQLEINKAEAASPHWFVAGARPAAMWVGVVSLLYSGLLNPIMTWVAMCYDLPPFPLLSDSVSGDILLGLLGIGGLRTIDKIKGVDTKDISTSRVRN